MTPFDIRETWGYQSGLMNLEIRRLGLSILQSFGFKAAFMEAGIWVDAARLEQWADRMNEEAACHRCNTTPERHEEHASLLR